MVAPNFTIVELDDPLDFFKGGVADALFSTAERAPPTRSCIRATRR